jgi:hypothetical protein
MQTCPLTGNVRKYVHFYGLAALHGGKVQRQAATTTDVSLGIVAGGTAPSLPAAEAISSADV